MLDKLLKHEFRITGRYILTILIILAIITPFTAIFMRISSYTNYMSESYQIMNNIINIFSTLSMTIYIVALISSVVVAIVLLIFQFYKSMITGQGYLTHTLPVKTSNIILSKLIVTYVWMIVSVVAAVVSFVIFTLIADPNTLHNIIHFFTNFSDILDLKRMHFLEFALTACNLIIAPLSRILRFFAAFAVGHRMNGHPVLGSAIAYIVVTIIIFILQLITNTVSYSIIDAIPDFAYDHLYLFFTLPSLMLSLVTGIVFYAVSVYMFKNKLNI